MVRKFVDRGLGDMTVAGDLAAIDGEQRRAFFHVEVDAIAARRGFGAPRSILDQRPDARIGPHDVGGCHRRAEIEARAFAEISDFFVACFGLRSEEHTSELQSLMRNSYAVSCLQQQKKDKKK